MFGNQAAMLEQTPREIVDLRRFLKQKTAPASSAKLDEPEFYSEYKKDGIKKSTPAAPIRSYDEFVAVSRYFEEKQMWRDKALWWCGIAFGLRCSDLTSLRWGNVLSDDGTFLRTTRLFERKTGKLKGLLITEAVQISLSEYLQHIPEPPKLVDYIFSPQTKGRGNGTKPLSTTQVYKILSQAGRSAGVINPISTHTMRKTYGDILRCVCQATVDPYRIELCRIALNHSNSRTTMRYLGVEEENLHSALMGVSDFLLGRTEKKELVLDEKTEQNEQIMEMLEEVLSLLDQGNTTGIGDENDQDT